MFCWITATSSTHRSRDHGDTRLHPDVLSRDAAGRVRGVLERVPTVAKVGTVMAEMLRPLSANGGES